MITWLRHLFDDDPEPEPEVEYDAAAVAAALETEEKNADIERRTVELAERSEKVIRKVSQAVAEFEAQARLRGRKFD